MLKNTSSYFFFGVGFVALVFTIARTYYLVWKRKKERELSRKPVAPQPEAPEEF
jgi:hypothetical protein